MFLFLILFLFNFSSNGGLLSLVYPLRILEANQEGAAVQWQCVETVVWQRLADCHPYLLSVVNLCSYLHYLYSQGDESQSSGRCRQTRMSGMVHLPRQISLYQPGLGDCPSEISRNCQLASELVK